MSDDLQARLSTAARDLEAAAGPLDAVAMQRIRAVARRRRIERRTTQTFAGVAAVAVVALAVTLGAAQRGTDPAPVPPAVTPTVVPTPSPTPTPAPQPTGPPERAADISDADVLARLQHPRTGEVWETPVLAPDLAPVLDPAGLGHSVYRVGTRGDAIIYVVQDSQYGTVYGLYEVGATGPRRIVCPSARTTDPCDTSSTDVGASPVAVDQATFYDTMTMPGSIDLGGGYAVTTTATRARDGFSPYGGGYLVVEPPDATQKVVRQLGALALVTEEFESYGPEMTSFAYSIRTPYGSLVRIDGADVPGGDFAGIRWAAGLAPTPTAGDDVRGVSPGSNACYDATFARETDHAASGWRQGGTTAQGRPVLVPVAGGNAIASTVRDWQEQNSWNLDETTGEMVSGAAAGYPFGTDDAFLAARALYAVQGPSGEWLLMLRQDASQVVWECA